MHSASTARRAEPSWRGLVGLVVALFLFTGIAGCQRQAKTPSGGFEQALSQLDQTENDPPNGMRVLFIGNSLTEDNDLPAILQALAATEPQPLVCKKATFSGGSLEDQWNLGHARQAIARGGWKIVVLQQGPSSLQESRVNLIEYARRFAEEIRRVGARPALYQVWPESRRARYFDAVCESYALAAEEVDGLLFPVGEAWRAAWRRDPDLALYSFDGFHPTPAASYLAALVMYEQLYDRPSAGLPARLTKPGSEAPLVDLPAEQASLLQAAATEANQKFRRP